MKAESSGATKWVELMKRVFTTGWRHSQLLLMALYSTKVHFVMHSATTAAEHLQTYPKHVYAEPLWHHMPNRRESLLSDTMKCVTSQLSASLRYGKEWVKSCLQPLYKQCHNWAQCKARCCSKWLNSGEKDLIWEGGLFDIRVFNPYVPLNRNLPKLPMHYHCHETQIVSSMCCFQETYSIAREVAM